MSTVAPAQQTVADLLKQFSKQPGCDSYSGDAAKVKLLVSYLWQRQLSPSLPFETFLSLFAPLADFNDQNRKHPEDSVYYHCPRAQAQAEKLGVEKWTAKEVVGIMTLYVDMVRLAESRSIAVPMTFDAFLNEFKTDFRKPPVQTATAPQVSQPSLFPEAAPAQPAAATEQPSAAPIQQAPAPTTVVAPATGQPSAPQQRIVYQNPEGRAVIGTVMSVAQDGDRRYVTLQSDAGEIFENVSAVACRLLAEPPPAPQPTFPTETVNGSIPQSKAANIKTALALTVAMGGVDLGKSIESETLTFGSGFAVDLCVLNGETGPYVAPQLVDPVTNNVLAELPPRKHFPGEYRFDYQGKTYVANVSFRGEK